MALAQCLTAINAFTQPLQLLAAPLALLTRIYVSWVFLKSGWLKLSDWESTKFLFREEYRVPLLPPELAAIAGTAGEIAFPLLLIAGLCGRLSALGLQAVNVLAVVSYAHVLFQEGFAAAIAQHYLWGFMLVFLIVHGPGAWSLDHLIGARNAHGPGRASVTTPGGMTA